MSLQYKATLDAGKTVLFIAGRLTLGEADSLREMTLALIGNGFKDIVLDCSQLGYCGSDGLGEIVRSYTLCRQKSGSLTLNRVPKRVLDLLAITKLLTIFTCLEIDYSQHPQFEIASEDLNQLTRSTALRSPDVLRILLALSNGRIQLLPGFEGSVVRLSTGALGRDELLVASPYVIAKLTRSYLRDEIEEFEDILNSPHSGERDIQRFLETHPKFLLGQDYKELHPQVVLEREDEGPLIPDFLLKPHASAHCDIVDIKLPTVPVLVGRPNRRRFSAAIADAAAQLRTYRDYFDDHARREAIKDRYGFTAFRPKLVVVAGRRLDIDPVLYKQIQDGTQGVDLVTYDDLLTRAKRFMLP